MSSFQQMSPSLLTQLGYRLGKSFNKFGVAHEFDFVHGVALEVIMWIPKWSCIGAFHDYESNHDSTIQSMRGDRSAGSEGLERNNLCNRVDCRSFFS
jgi:hypothetical protein